MLVESMSKVEIVKEIQKDYQFVLGKSEHLHKKLRRKAIKSREKHASTFEYYRSPLKNDWILYLHHNVKAEGLASVLYHRDSKNEFNAYAVEIDWYSNFVVNSYSSHFFQRYNERCLNKDGLSQIDIIKEFIRRNPVKNKELLPHQELNKQTVF